MNINELVQTIQLKVNKSRTDRYSYRLYDQIKDFEFNELRSVIENEFIITNYLLLNYEPYVVQDELRRILYPKIVISGSTDNIKILLYRLYFFNYLTVQLADCEAYGLTECQTNATIIITIGIA